MLLATHDLASASVADAVYLFVVGFAYDLLALLYVATPLALWLWLAPGWLLRRPLGRLLHAGLWFWVEHDFSVAEMLRDVGRRPFITAGFVSFILLVPLAATSNAAAIRRLGAYWQRLHRLVYLIAVAAIFHYAWHKAGKNDLAPVLPYALTVAGLLGIRLWWALAGRLRARRGEALKNGNEGGGAAA